MEQTLRNGFMVLLALLWCNTITQAQNRTVKGNVTDAADGAGLPGVNVLLKGTTTGVVTDIDGNYSIDVPSANGVLIFSSIGYLTQEITVGDQTLINISMALNTRQLEEVVVTAVGIERDRKALGYSVESVGGEDLINARESNLVNSIAGKVSGVQITNSGGQVGASSRIVIRGAASFLQNNQPLFVIDGVPIDNTQLFGGGQNNVNGTGTGDSPLFFGGTTNRVVDIDPANIESMSVLKGASATALYGIRAANGVVLITTKSGQRGTGPKVSYGFNFGVSEPRLPEFQETYAQGVNGVYQSGLPTGTQDRLAFGPRMDTLRLNAAGEYDPNGTLAPRYDNVEDFFRTGRTFDHNFSISGGTANSSYLLSYSNKTERGIVPNNDLDRHNVLAKFTATLGTNLDVSTSLNYIKTDMSAATEGNGIQSYLWTVYGAPISYDLRGDGPQDYLNPDGTQRLFREARNNPYFIVDNNGLESGVNRFLPNINLSYKLNDWLTVSNRLGADIYTDNRDYIEVNGTVGTFPTGRLYVDVFEYRQINNDFIVRGNKRYGDFGFDVLVGSQINDIRTERLFTQGVDLGVPGFENLANASTVTSVQTTTQQRLVGIYGQATVDYQNIAFITLTARNDWSSTLPIDNNSFFYPSISGSFIFTDAVPFLQDNNVLTFGKVRLGWAQIGNATSPYNTQETLYTQSDVGDGQRGSILFPFQGQNGFSISNIIGNPNLLPEETDEFEAGLEFELFNGRIRFEGSYYNRVSENQIFQAPVAASAGAISRFVNAGSLRNEGVEMMLNMTPISIGGFEWDLGVNFTRNVNTVEELTEGVENIRLAGFTSPGIYIVRDQGYGVIWGSQYLRNEQGQVLINDDPSSSRYGLPVGLDPSLGVIGDTQPDFLAGFRTTFRYTSEKLGSFSLGAVVDVREGGDILNLDNFYLTGWGFTEVTEDRSGENTFVYPNGVLSDGQPNNIEVPLDETYWRQNWGIAQEEWVEDGSFVRLREVTFSYALPRSLLENVPFGEVRFQATGRNLLLHAPNFTGADPETSVYGNANGQGFYNFITPATVGWNFGVNVSF